MPPVAKMTFCAGADGDGDDFGGGDRARVAASDDGVATTVVVGDVTGESEECRSGILMIGCWLAASASGVSGLRRWASRCVLASACRDTASSDVAGSAG